ncbi:MAG TPA: hypothetical protein VFT98_20455 [Myxococcota bacterium]|nr:hypothetical protein [Myxococcota bacterium]
MNDVPLASAQRGAPPTCSYDLQFAHFDHDQIEDRGVASAAEILEAFDAFDWPGQADAANRLQKVAPTFAVRDLDRDRLFWVSCCGDGGNFFFVNDYSYRGEVRRLLRGQGWISAPTHELSLSEARRGIQLFVTGEHDALLTLLGAGSR